MNNSQDYYTRLLNESATMKDESATMKEPSPINETVKCESEPDKRRKLLDVAVSELEEEITNCEHWIKKLFVQLVPYLPQPEPERTSPGEKAQTRILPEGVQRVVKQVQRVRFIGIAIRMMAEKIEL